MKNNNLMMTLIITVIVGAVAFLGGMKYQQSKATTPQGQTAQGASGQRGQRGQGRFGNGTMPIRGQIIASDDKSITIKLMDGSSKIVLLSNSTQISKMADASKSDLAAGQQVLVLGTNSNGAIVAQSIQLNPRFGAGPGATGSGTPNPAM